MTQYIQKNGHLAELIKEASNLEELPSSIQDFVHQLVGNKRPIGVIFYGSALRTKDLSGLLDFYVVLDHLGDWPRNSFSRIANALLPPNIEYHEIAYSSGMLRAKVALLTVEQLNKALGPFSYDTTMWARFCQPVKLIGVRGDKEELILRQSLIRAVKTASWWAAILGPPQGSAVQYWQNLFSHTYATELRVEGQSRSNTILEGKEQYYQAVLRASWESIGLDFIEQDEIFTPDLKTNLKKRGHQQWAWRNKIGRPLNLLRLTKAAFTFEGGAQYAAWKINRHQGIELNLTLFQQHHPILCAPWILFKLYRQGVFKH